MNMHWNAQNHIWKPQSNNIIIMFMIFVFCFSPICFLYLKYLFGLSHFSFSICNHLTLCARWCFILHWYSCVLVWWSFFFLRFSFICNCTCHFYLSSPKLHAYLNTRAQLLNRALILLFSSVLCTFFQQILIHINNSESFFFVSFHMRYHHLYAYPMSWRTQKK